MAGNRASLQHFSIRLWDDCDKYPDSKFVYTYRPAQKIYNSLLKHHFEIPTWRIWPRWLHVVAVKLHFLCVLIAFINKKDQLLVLNVEDPSAYSKLADFLNVRNSLEVFPLKNTSNARGALFIRRNAVANMIFDDYEAFEKEVIKTNIVIASLRKIKRIVNED